MLSEKGLPFSVLGSFENTNVGSSLVYGALCSLVVLSAWRAAPQAGRTGSRPRPVMAMLPAITILLAALIGSVVRDVVETGKYLLPGERQPADRSAACCGCLSSPAPCAFATGTSWGTLGIMLPLAGDMVAASDISLMLPMLAAVLAGLSVR